MCTFALGLAAVAGGASAAGSLMSASASASAHRANAQLFEDQATQREQKAEYDVQQARRHFVRTEGEVRANIGGSGVSASSFSDVFADDSSEAALEQAAIRHSGAMEARNLRFQAAAERAKASSAKTAGILGAIAGGVSAFAPFAKTGVDFSGLFSTGSNAVAGTGWQTTVNATKQWGYL